MISASKLKYWTSQVHDVSVRFAKLTGGSTVAYVDATLFAFLHNTDKDDIRDCIVATSKMRKSVRRYQDEILQLAGVGLEWNKATEVEAQVSEAVVWLEELLCFAMLSSADLESAYNSRSLMYQRA